MFKWEINIMEKLLFGNIFNKDFWEFVVIKMESFFFVMSCVIFVMVRVLMKFVFVFFKGWKVVNIFLFICLLSKVFIVILDGVECWIKMFVVMR